jgi:hypothetical protein
MFRPNAGRYAGLFCTCDVPPEWTTPVSIVLVKKLLGLVDFAGKVRAAATIRVIEKHEGAVAFSDEVLVDASDSSISEKPLVSSLRRKRPFPFHVGCLPEFENQSRFPPIHSRLEAAFVVSSRSDTGTTSPAAHGNKSSTSLHTKSAKRPPARRDIGNSSCFVAEDRIRGRTKKAAAAMPKPTRTAEVILCQIERLRIERLVATEMKHVFHHAPRCIVDIGG